MNALQESNDFDLIEDKNAKTIIMNDRLMTKGKNLFSLGLIKVQLLRTQAKNCEKQISK